MPRGRCARGNRAVVRGFRRKPVESGMLRAAVDATEGEQLPEQSVAADLRFRAARPDHLGGGRPVVRPVQPVGAGRSQRRAGRIPADHEPRDRVRLYRKESGAGHQAEQAAHPLSVARGTPPSPCGTGRLRARDRVAAATGGHHPPSAGDRLPEGRNRGTVRGGRDRTQSRGQQDGSEKSLPERAGPRHRRTPASDGQARMFFRRRRIRPGPARGILRSGTR